MRARKIVESQLLEMKGFSFDGILTNDSPPKFLKCSDGNGRYADHTDLVVRLAKARDPKTAAKLGKDRLEGSALADGEDSLIAKWAEKQKLVRIAFDGNNQTVYASTPTPTSTLTRTQRNWLEDYGIRRELRVVWDKYGTRGGARREVIYEPPEREF